MDNQWIKTRTPEFRELFERIKVATRLCSKLSAYCMDEAESIQEARPRSPGQYDTSQC
jgi:hypothetical protein